MSTGPAVRRTRLRGVALAALATTTLGCTNEGELTAEDLGAVFIRRSACREVALGPSAAVVVAQFTGLPAATSSELACGRSADDCEAFFACNGVDPETTCDPATFEPTCDGTVRVTCRHDGLVRRQDCADDDDGNPVCLLDEGGVPRCALGPCEGPEGLRCEDDTIIFCGSGVESRAQDCAPAGQRCAVNATGDRAACVDRLTPCSANTCDGDVLLRCHPELGVAERRCADGVAGRCDEDEGEARCVIGAMDCADAVVECDGSIARFCVDGAWVELDCGSFQGGTCVDESTPDEPALRCVVD